MSDQPPSANSSPVEAFRRQELATLGQLAGIATALLPAIGVAVRSLSFGTDSKISNPLRIGAAAPLAELAGLGALVIIPPVIMFVLLLGTESVRRRLKASSDSNVADGSEKPEVNFRRSLEPVLLLVMAGAVGILLLSALLFAGFFIAFATGALLGFVVRCMLKRIEKKKVAITLGTTWPVLGLLIVGAIVSSILVGPNGLVGVSDYKFADGIGVPEGRYVRLGESGDRIFLVPCQPGDRAVIVVQRDKVLAERMRRAKKEQPASLYEALTTDAPLRPRTDYTCRVRQ